MTELTGIPGVEASGNVKADAGTVQLRGLFDEAMKVAVEVEAAKPAKPPIPGIAPEKALAIVPSRSIITCVGNDLMPYF